MVEAEATEVNAGGIVVAQDGGDGTLAALAGTGLSYTDNGSAALTVGEGAGSVGIVNVSGNTAAVGAYGKVSVGVGGVRTIAELRRPRWGKRRLAITTPPARSR